MINIHFFLLNDIHFNKKYMGTYEDWIVFHEQN